jgi:hypothetical protein
MRLFLLAPALLLCGCMSFGNDFSLSTVQSLKKGMTEAQVIKKLGQPGTRTRLGDGSEELTWDYEHVSALGASHGRLAVLKFGRNGKYVGVVSTSQSTY